MTEMTEQELRAIKGARLMLYAWIGERQNQLLPRNPHIDQSIAELNAVIAAHDPYRSDLKI